MIFYLYIIESPMNLEWYHWVTIISLCIIVVIFVDVKYVFPDSQAYSFHKNPEWMKLRKDVTQNSKKLDELLELKNNKR